MTRYEMFNAIYSGFTSMLVFIDADDSGVRPKIKLPAYMNGLHPLILEPGNASNHQNLAVDERGFSALMSFNKSPFHVFIPWRSVKAFSCPDFTIQWTEEGSRVAVDQGGIEEKPNLRLV